VKRLGWRGCRYLLASHYIFYWSLRRRMFDWHNPQYTIDPGSFKDICKDILIPKGVLIPVEVPPAPASCPPSALSRCARRCGACVRATERPRSCLPTEFDNLGGSPLNLVEKGFQFKTFLAMKFTTQML